MLVFLGLCVLDLGTMYATDVVRRQTDVRHHHRLMPSLNGAGHYKPQRNLNTGSNTIKEKERVNVSNVRLTVCPLHASWLVLVCQVSRCGTDMGRGIIM